MSKEKKQRSAGSQVASPLFDKENYKWMLIGLGVLALGFFLMAGGKSTDPNVFNADEVYSTTRITIAPLLIIAGFVIEIFAIMKKSKNS
ncbi:MAG: DUF3098 domain-containing protein [Chitinophagaceae bacterium]|nr:DUF3098 domain-containing protein [Chitinophagaceae bacterium]